MLEETLRPDAAETVAFMRDQQVDLKLISGDARETVTAVAQARRRPRATPAVIEGPDLPDDRAASPRRRSATRSSAGSRPSRRRRWSAALADRGRFTAMIGDGVNDVPALKQARLAVAMGSGSQITKGVADIVLLRDQFSMLPRAVAEGRRIARNIHRLGRLYLTKSVYAGFLILLAAIFGFTFPFLPRQLTVAALLTIGIPSFVLALAPSEGPLYRGRLLRALAAFAFPAGIAMGIASLLSFFFVDSIFGGTLDEGRTAATTTLIVLGLCFILLLERGPGREHITIQSYMLAMVAALGALFAGDPRDRAGARLLRPRAALSAGQWFVALLCVAIGLVIAGAALAPPYIQQLELPGRDRARRRPGPTHTPRTGEFDAVAVPEPGRAQPSPRSGRPLRRRREMTR